MRTRPAYASGPSAESRSWAISSSGRPVDDVDFFRLLFYSDGPGGPGRRFYYEKTAKEIYMSKAHRGAGLREEKARSGRGACPVCKRTGIKVIYEQEINGKKYFVCKQCRAAISHGKKQEELAAL